MKSHMVSIMAYKNNRDWVYIMKKLVKKGEFHLDFEILEN